jgi:hypothetical protein
MSAPAWADFLRWFHEERQAYIPGPSWLYDAAKHVQTEREAMAALLGAGVRLEHAERAKTEWLAEHSMAGPAPGGVVLRVKDEDDEALAYLSGLVRNGLDEEAFGPIERAFIFPSRDAAEWWMRGREESGLEPWPEYEIRPAPGG